MKRLLIVGLLALFPALATAQTPVADEEPGIFTRIAERAGLTQAENVARQFEIAGISFTEPVVYQFFISDLTSPNDAETALQATADQFADVFMGWWNPADGEATISAASAPDVGNDQTAFVITIESDAFAITYGYVFVRTGPYIVGAAAGGIMGNMIESVEPYLTSIVSALDDPPDDLLDALPVLDDMPPGFIETTD